MGTKPLLTNGSITRKIGVLLAVSTLSAASPIPTVSQVKATVIRTRSANAANQSPSPALER